MRRWMKLVKSESGVALPMALGIMMVLAIALVTTIELAGSGSRSSQNSKASDKVLAVAESGANEALSILGAATDPTVPTLLPGTTTPPQEGATATYSGVYDSVNRVWTITSKGSMANPTGAGTVTRTLTQKVTVNGGLTDWDRVYNHDTTQCMSVPVNIEGPFTTRGNLCMSGTAILTGSPIAVGGNTTMAAGNSIGTSGTPIQKAEMVGTCKWSTQAANTPCSAVDHVYANTITTSSDAFVKPTVDWDYWYANAKPGPMQNCTTGSFPGGAQGFDNNTTYNKSRDEVELTPPGSSYTCQVHDGGGTLLGELSWNHLTHVLKIHGTIFIDTKELKVVDDDQLVNYQGRATIYIPGKLHSDEIICAGGDGTRNCRTPEQIRNWDPNQNLLALVIGGKETGGEPLHYHKPTAFQGILYSEQGCKIGGGNNEPPGPDGGAWISGPIICGKFVMEENGGYWGDYVSWPPLESLPPGIVGGNSNTYRLKLGQQY